MVVVTRWLQEVWRWSSIQKYSSPHEFTITYERSLSQATLWREHAITQHVFLLHSVWTPLRPFADGATLARLSDTHQRIVWCSGLLSALILIQLQKLTMWRNVELLLIIKNAFTLGGAFRRGRWVGETWLHTKDSRFGVITDSHLFPFAWLVCGNSINMKQKFCPTDDKKEIHSFVDSVCIKGGWGLIT